MKTTFIAYEVEDGVLKPHDHPVFTGEAVYDLPAQADVQINPELNVREFTGVGEALQALKDYHMEHPKEEQVDAGNFIFLQTFFASKDSALLNRSNNRGAANKGKRKVVSTKKSK